MRRAGRLPALGALTAALAVLLAGCTGAPLPQRGGAAGLAVTDLAGLPADEVTRRTVAALEAYWRDAFPAAFGRPWREIAGFVPVATADPDAPAPCLERAADAADQAFYCPAGDIVLWDADGLVPDLLADHGPPGLVVVLAHEVGHAVQARLGIETGRRADPDRYPTILLEAMADCYAGAALAHLVGGGARALPLSLAQRDAALLALVGFRDPLGTIAADETAHGNAFDRVSAFQDGYVEGPAECADTTFDQRRFTQRRFGSAGDLARGGNLPLDRLLPALEADVRLWTTGVVTARGASWTAPALTFTPACPAAALAPQGPVSYCPADGTVAVDPGELARLQDGVGDFARGTLIASRYGMAALAALGAPVEGPAAGRAAVCLAGAYAGRLLDRADRGFTLSPGDLDEAVQILLAADWTARDAAGGVDPALDGYERVARFRVGLLDGPGTCLPDRGLGHAGGGHSSPWPP